MCLYPVKMMNKKYTATEKNGGCIPEPPIIGTDQFGLPIYDTRVLQIEVPCGQCIECRTTKAREWQIRLLEEIKAHKYNYFVTLTFAPKELEELCKKTRLKECNAVAGYAVRHMLERWRKDHKKSIKHWLITELGHEGTERIHLHGLLFTDENLEFGDMDNNKLRTWKYWKYGHIYVGEYVNEQTINYISKYITKIDTDHKGFIGEILASPGIGRQFIDKLSKIDSDRYQYKPKKATDYYRLTNGVKVKLPKYYKNKLYTEDEKEAIWRDFMDLQRLSILGQAHNTRTVNESNIRKILDNAREYNNAMEYGDNSGEWRKKEYNITRRMLQQEERNKRLAEMKEAIFNNHLNRSGLVTPEEVREMKKQHMTGHEIDKIIAFRGRNF